MEDTADEPVDISTHTLTWSVTYCSGVIFPLSAISTHTLTWSVTRENLKTLTTYSHFNSHAHVERDGTACRAPRNRSDFNSHAHVERDSCRCKKMNLLIISTHTLTWSVTFQILCPLQRQHHFNSHAHVERDLIRKITA